ncbi:MAG: hypothetical protein JW395_1678 [Nitrospira sp.]|nr:hypothetical protein [Nitrospira sp.]
MGDPPRVQRLQRTGHLPHQRQQLRLVVPVLCLYMPLALLHHLAVPTRKTAALGGNAMLQDPDQPRAGQIPNCIQHLGVGHHRLLLGLPIFEYIGLQDGNLATVPSHNEAFGLPACAQLPSDPPTTQPRPLVSAATPRYTALPDGRVYARAQRFTEGRVNAPGMPSAGIILDPVERIGVTVRGGSAAHVRLESLFRMGPTASNNLQRQLADCGLFAA